MKGFLYIMNKLIEQFGSEKRWVNWNPKKVDGKITKVPLGSSNKPSTWSTYDELKSKDRVGIMFGLDNMFLGVDIDHCIEDGDIIHEEKEKIISFIDYANTYYELSPSKSGLHLYFKLSEPLELLTNKRAPYEAYTSLRYFTVTGDNFDEKPVRTISKDEALELLQMIGYPWGKEKKEPVQQNNNSNITNDEVLNKMFSSKNGSKVKKLYDGDVSDYKNDLSSGDLALCSHLAFWTNKNHNQMEDIWMASPLGGRNKTQSRKDYRDRTIEVAIEGCDETYSPLMVVVNEDEMDTMDFDFMMTKFGKKVFATLCLENIAKVLRLHPSFKDKIRYDTFKKDIEVNINGEWLHFEDKHILYIQQQISLLFNDFQKIGKDMVFDAMCLVAYENTVDSAIAYLEALEWDGEQRLETWLSKTYGAPDDVYHRSVGSNWLKGLVKRMVFSGCKFDYVLVLEGKQGAKKSYSLAVLGGDWHVETTMGTNSKDFFMQFNAKCIIEFSEGETLSRTEVKRMKAIITTQVDRYRAPYQRNTKDYPRRCVFAMTTNSSEYLKDETGNRRWLPVELAFEEANVEWLAENRDQLYAEAYHRVVTKKETTWDFPQDEVTEAQDNRRVADPNLDRVADWYFNVLKDEVRDDGISVYQCFMGAFNENSVANKMMTKQEEMSIANIFRNGLKLEKKRTSINGVKQIRWYPNSSFFITGEIRSVKTVSEEKLDEF